MEQLTVASMKKAIDELLLAHNSIIDAWFEQWAIEQRARINTAFEAQEKQRKSSRMGEVNPAL
jgi:hypothetical protein